MNVMDERNKNPPPQKKKTNKQTEDALRSVPRSYAEAKAPNSDPWAAFLFFTIEIGMSTITRRTKTPPRMYDTRSHD